MYDIISQIVILVLGASAIILVAKKNKWGFVLGLLSQPFWYITAYIHEQWGVFLVSIVYTISWCIGIYFDLYIFNELKPDKVAENGGWDGD